MTIQMETKKTPNEYRESLQRYEEIQRRWDSFINDFAEGRIPPEEELLVFGLDLDKYWPLMFSVEQRQRFRELKRYVINQIDGNYRHPSKRKSAGWGAYDEYVGIFGQIVRPPKGLGDICDEAVHDGKPVLVLTQVIGMADAVDNFQSTSLRTKSSIH